MYFKTKCNRDLSQLSYRPEIEGLRAIAVLLVIIYHAQFEIFGQRLLVGGYIGVDIFFVISGYLISRIIFSEIYKTKSFNFAKFYERRARRLFPVLLTVIFVSLPYAFINLSRADFKDFIDSIFASSFFVSNFFFYFSTTQYGSEDALLKPFLHTWSLGVEEQFYLLFPPLVFILFKYFRKYLLIILIGLLLSSLQFANLMDMRNSDFNFYSPFSRFWEFAVGSLLAYREINFRNCENSIAIKVFPVLGFLMIVCSVFYFNNNTPHPSYHTIILIIGVALVILFASENELLIKILGSKPFVWIGLISYSAYLWHYPIFAFYRRFSELSNLNKFELIVLTFILSVFSYFYIERPFRDFNKTSQKFFFVSLTAALMVICSLSVFSKNGYKFYIDNLDKISLIRPITMADSSAYLEQWYNEKHFGVQRTSSDTKLPKVLILGNSHGVDFFRTLDLPLTDKYNFHIINPSSRKVMFQPSCILTLIKNNKNICSNYTYSSDELENIIKIFNRSKFIIIASRFNNYENEMNRVGELVEYLKEQDKKIILASNVLEIPHNPSTKFHNPLNRFIQMNGRLPNQEELSKIETETFHLVMSNKNVLDVNIKLEKIAKRLNIGFLDLTNTICRTVEQKCHVLTTDNGIVLWDYGHLAVKATKFVGKLYLENSELPNLTDTLFN